MKYIPGLQGTSSASYTSPIRNIKTHHILTWSLKSTSGIKPDYRFLLDKQKHYWGLLVGANDTHGRTSPKIEKRPAGITLFEFSNCHYISLHIHPTQPHSTPSTPIHVASQTISLLAHGCDRIYPPSPSSRAPTFQNNVWSRPLLLLNVRGLPLAFSSSYQLLTSSSDSSSPTEFSSPIIIVS